MKPSSVTQFDATISPRKVQYVILNFSFAPYLILYLKCVFDIVVELTLSLISHVVLFLTASQTISGEALQRENDQKLGDPENPFFTVYLLILSTSC